MAWYKLNSHVAYDGEMYKVSELAKEKPEYLLMLHNGHYNVFLCKEVFEAMGLWEQYKDTDICKRTNCTNS